LSSDLVLLDELREHHNWDAWSAVTKTTLARPAPQVLRFSNAGDKSSIVLASLREKALASAADRNITSASSSGPIATVTSIGGTADTPIDQRLNSGTALIRYVPRPHEERGAR
jgi:hypothetical protein